MAVRRPSRRCADLGANERRMALRRRHDRFGSRIDHAHRSMQKPRGQRDERLHRQIELCAEAAANRGRNDAHLLRREAQDFRDVVAIHVRCLGTSLNLDAIGHAPREACLRLDVGVFHEGGFEFALDRHIRGRERGLDIASHDPAAGQYIVGTQRHESAPRQRRSLRPRWSAPAGCPKSRGRRTDRGPALPPLRRR